ncbi:hypothetical protein DIPPA_10212 [Diplonema papillatum]|nr:hypothetical protein DIPPA_10212 [Diplonema papillatum]|eukprot:gene12543-19416_t
MELRAVCAVNTTSQIILYQSYPDEVQSFALPPFDVARTGLKNKGVLLDATEGDGGRIVYRHYPHNNLTLFLIHRQNPRAYDGAGPPNPFSPAEDLKVASGFLHVVYHLFILHAGQKTDFCVPDHRSMTAIKEKCARARGALLHLLKDYPGPAPASLIVMSPEKPIRLSKETLGKVDDLLESLLHADPLADAAVMVQGSMTIASTSRYHSLEGLDSECLTWALPLVLDSLPRTTGRDFMFHFALGQMRIVELLLNSESDLRLIFMYRIGQVGLSEIVDVMTTALAVPQNLSTVHLVLSAFSVSSSRLLATSPVVPLPPAVTAAYIFTVPAVPKLCLSFDACRETWWNLPIVSEDHVVGEPNTGSGSRPPTIVFGSPDPLSSSLAAATLSQTLDLLTVPLPTYGKHLTTMTSGHHLTLDGGHTCAWSVLEAGEDTLRMLVLICCDTSGPAEDVQLHEDDGNWRTFSSGQIAAMTAEISESVLHGKHKKLFREALAT